MIYDKLDPSLQPMKPILFDSIIEDRILIQEYNSPSVHTFDLKIQLEEHIKIQLMGGKITWDMIKRLTNAVHMSEKLKIHIGGAESVLPSGLNFKHQETDDE